MHNLELKRIFAFVGRENVEAGKNLRQRIVKSKGQGRALLKSKKKVHDSIARNLVAEKKDPSEYLVEIEDSGEQVAILDAMTLTPSRSWEWQMAFSVDV